MKAFKITVEFAVSDNWIEDGFDANSPAFIERLRNYFEDEVLPRAYSGSETKAEISVADMNDNKLADMLKRRRIREAKEEAVYQESLRKATERNKRLAQK